MYDPGEHKVDEVQKKLASASRAERNEILAREVNGLKRKTILEAYGVDPNTRLDSTGRPLYPWEVTGDDMADSHRHPQETDEQRAAREAQLEQDATVGSTEQLGSTASDSGVAPAGDPGTSADAGASTVATTAGADA